MSQGAYRLDQDGFSILRNVFTGDDCARLIDSLSRVREERAIRSRGGMFAIRNLLQLSPEVRELASSAPITSIVKENLKSPVWPVRATLFDKIGSANWLVPWHQDLTICVAARLPVPEFGPWTLKAGVWHVQPPAPVLEGMLSVRIHLDDCPESNGPLRVLPGTHNSGRLTARAIAERRESGGPVSCIVSAGDVVLFKPLLLHASSAASTAGHRRVIQLEFASTPLPGGLQWALPDA